jgi:voltage-gated sodium channel
MILLILFNALIITLAYFPTLRGNGVLEFLDKLVILLFLLEVIVKIGTYGPRLYFSSGWNRFDFLLTMLSLPALLIGLVELPDLSFWLLLRLIRLVRLVRLLAFVPHIDQLLEGIGRAVRASFLVMATLAFANFMLAMVTCHLLGDIVPESFGNPYKAMYSMFQVFTIEGWNEIPAQVSAELQAGGYTIPGLNTDVTVAIAQTFFATVLLLGGVLGLSLANAIFVDEMTIDNTNELESKVDEMGKQINEILAILRQQQAVSLGEKPAVDPRRIL